MQSQRCFFVHLFHLQKFLPKTLYTLRNVCKFRKLYLNPLSLIRVKYKYLKHLTSNLYLDTMTSQKCVACNKVSITESSMEVQNSSTTSHTPSGSGLQKKEEKSSRSICKESIKLVKDDSTKRKPISFTIKKKSGHKVLDNTLVPSQSRSTNNLHFSHVPQLHTNFAQQNHGTLFTQHYVPIPLTNLLQHSFFTPHIQHRVHRSSAADYNNATKSTQSDKQQAWTLRRLQHTTLGKSLAKKPNTSKSCTFKIMSYNVLSQELLEEHPFLYTHHNPHALKWDQRWYSIQQEIKFHNADILCLQEVQSSHLLQYTTDLGLLGYKGIYKQRTGIRRDGCAIYYKESTFNLVEHATIEFNQKDIPVLDRDNVAIIGKFAPKNNSKNEFVVATTHLLYNRKREDVRLAQTQVLLTEIDRIAYKFDPRRSTDHLPVIITGDFNLTPDSPVYQFITRGRLNYEHLNNRTLSREQSHYGNATGKILIPTLLRITDNCQHADLVEQRNHGRTDLSREEELQLIHLHHSERKYGNKSRKMNRDSLFSSGTLSHHFKLFSAYVHDHGQDSEATTFQDNWVTVDYIFYSGDDVDAEKRSEDRLKLISRYSLPTTHRLEGMKIPNMALGSDHLCLVATFRLDS